MKLTVNNKRLLIIVGSALMILLAYYFVFTPQMEAAFKLADENEKLYEKHAQLVDIEKNQEKYKADTAQMEAEVLAYLKQFPSEIRAEDVFMLDRDIEQESEITITTIGLQDPALLASVEGITIKNTEENQKLADKNNQATKDQVDKIEGVEKEDGTVVTANATSMSLYTTLNETNFAGGYDGLKRAIEYINGLERRTTVEGMTVTFDAATGNLAGSLSLNMFSMSNTGAVYTEPTVDGVPVGRGNVFGTVEVQ